MPTARQTLPTSWDDSARVDAEADTDVLITDTQGRRIFFAITGDETAPSIPVTQGHAMAPGQTLGLKLAAGEYLWLAAETTFDCTLTTGSA